MASKASIIVVSFVNMTTSRVHRFVQAVQGTKLANGLAVIDVFTIGSTDRGSFIRNYWNLIKKGGRVIRARSRKAKLTELKWFANLETGEIRTEHFRYENTLYSKAILMKSLAARIKDCKRCPGLNIKRYTEACPGWGDLNSPIFFIGQSLHEPGVASGLPFILGSGYSIDAALRLSGLLRKDVFFSNVIHCHPPANRASTDEEKENCYGYLEEELAIVKPKLIVALGNDAQATMDIIENTLVTDKVRKYRTRHPASFMYSSPEDRIDWIIKLSLEMDKIL